MVRTLLVSSIVVATVAGIDAVRGDHWDQFAMLLILGSLSAIALAGDTRRAPSVRLRPDLLASSAVGLVGAVPVVAWRRRRRGRR